MHRCRIQIADYFHSIGLPNGDINIGTRTISDQWDPEVPRGIKCQTCLKGYYYILKYIEIPPGKCILTIKKYNSNKEMVHNGGEDLHPKNLRKHNNLEL